MTVSRRKVRDEADARACLADVERSGRTLKEWANANAVDGRSLHIWRVNLERWRATSPCLLRLVELVAQPRAAARYVVRLGDVSVEVDDSFDDHTLRRLLAVLSC